MPTTIGSIARPDSVGVIPSTTCRYTGMKIIDPNIATPIRNPKTLATEKIELPNSRIGMIGSAARRSMNTNATASSTPAPSSARPVPDAQPSSGPAQAV